MKTLLICPSQRPEVELLSRSVPLATVPLLGQSVLEYWLSSLAVSGAREVIVLAHDRPEQVQALVGDGARWGLSATVVSESRELTPAQALLKYSQELDPVPAQSGIAVLDHFPGQEQLPLFTSYMDLFTALREWLPKALTPDRVGYRELRRGVWASTSARISPEAKLRSPCWIGAHVVIGAESVIGPYAVIEDEVMVEARAEIVRSHVGRSTFVGSLARIKTSLCQGSTLVNWHSGSIVEVPDAYLLCALRQPRSHTRDGWFARLAESFARRGEEPSVLWKALLLNKES